MVANNQNQFLLAQALFNFFNSPSNGKTPNHLKRKGILVNTAFNAELKNTFDTLYKALQAHYYAQAELNILKQNNRAITETMIKDIKKKDEENTSAYNAWLALLPSCPASYTQLCDAIKQQTCLLRDIEHRQEITQKIDRNVAFINALLSMPESSPIIQQFQDEWNAKRKTAEENSQEDIVKTYDSLSGTLQKVLNPDTTPSDRNKKINILRRYFIKDTEMLLTLVDRSDVKLNLTSHGQYIDYPKFSSLLINQTNFIVLTEDEINKKKEKYALIITQLRAFKPRNSSCLDSLKELMEEVTVKRNATYLAGNQEVTHQHVLQMVAIQNLLNQSELAYQGEKGLDHAHDVEKLIHYANQCISDLDNYPEKKKLHDAMITAQGVLISNASQLDNSLKQYNVMMDNTYQLVYDEALQLANRQVTKANSANKDHSFIARLQ